MLAEVPPVPTRSKAPIASEMPAMAMASASRFLENLISALVGCLLGSMGGVIWGLSMQWARRRSRIRTAPAWPAPLPRTNGCWGSRRARGSSPCTPSHGKGRKHHVQHPQGHRLVSEAGRSHHQYELRRSPGSLDRSRAQGGLRQRRRADRRRRQCRAEISPALPCCRSERDRGDGD